MYIVNKLFSLILVFCSVLLISLDLVGNFFVYSILVRYFEFVYFGFESAEGRILQRRVCGRDYDKKKYIYKSCVNFFKIKNSCC